MKPKTYSVRKHLNQKNKTFFIIDYKVNERVDKQIQFTSLEHYLQFTDLLKQLDYKEVLTSKSIPTIIKA
jgi:hypothetical protein|tara:strand:+ start:969 stop:1178 length:210 start_codon:yes stop_codon:yes gene_type:complete